MSTNLDKLFIENENIYNNIVDLLFFLNKIFNEYNDKIVVRNRQLDFYDLFFYMLHFNSSINETHRSSNYNFNTENNVIVSESAFINRLIKLDNNFIKEINDKFINFYYTLFNIDINNIVTAVDGSNIKLLSSLKMNFKLNKNDYYTNATISCVYDINNQLPLFMNINKSFNEVDNLLKQLDDNVIKKYNYKITTITDRGYDCYKLIKYNLENNILFVSRITKTNAFINNLKNNKNSSIFTITINNKNYTLHIIKYTNIQKPDIIETKNELILKINDIDKKLNLIKNNLINEKTKYDDLCDQNKLNNKKLKTLKLKKKNFKNANNAIKRVRVLKSLSKKNIKQLKDDINKLKDDRNKIKSKYNKLETYEHSDFYIITNNLKYSLNELKEIYKKRWCVETSFKFEKTILNLNQMNNKNIQLIKQNVYIIQFIYIMNSFINKLLENIIKKNHYLNKTQIFESLHKDIFSLLKEVLKNKKCTLKNKTSKNHKTIIKHSIDKKKLKKTIDKLIFILKILSRYQIKNNKNDRNYERVKKRTNNNKFNHRNKEINNT